jgi:hypothetical protein
MAKVIEFYIPKRFRRRAALVPQEKRGKVIEFCIVLHTSKEVGLAYLA